MTIEVVNFQRIEDPMERDLACVIAMLDYVMEATGERVDPDDEAVLLAIREDQNKRLGLHPNCSDKGDGAQ